MPPSVLKIFSNSSLCSINSIRKIQMQCLLLLNSNYPKLSSNKTRLTLCPQSIKVNDNIKLFSLSLTVFFFLFFVSWIIVSSPSEEKENQSHCFLLPSGPGTSPVGKAAPGAWRSGTIQCNFTIWWVCSCITYQPDRPI